MADLVQAASVSSDGSEAMVLDTDTPSVDSSLDPTAMKKLDSSSGVHSQQADTGSDNEAVPASWPDNQMRSQPQASSSRKSQFALRSSVLSSSTPGSSGRGPKTSPPRPSASPFVLNPPKLANPYAKPDQDDEIGVSTDQVKTKSQVKRDEEEGLAGMPDSSSGVQLEVINSELAVSSTTPARLAFVPLHNSASPAPTAAASSTTASTTPATTAFVFGQNLHERADAESRSDGEDAGAIAAAVARTNGATSEMLFTSVLQRELPDKNIDSGGDAEKKSLSEAAREYEESRAVKRKYDEVTVVTGEEEESNVLQMNCKLFAFDKETSTWIERGRGTLRVNDLAVVTQSRVVMRATGSLRVMLNTKIWSGMSVDRPSPKSVRLTAMDNTGIIKIFLITASPKEIEQLFKSLDWRVSNLKKLATTTPPVKKTVLSDENN